MSVNKVNSDGSLSRVAGGTLYADAPIGTIVPFGGSTVPNGYLLCDGAEVLKTAYAELYAAIGDSFGTASLSTKFVLPDLRESVPKGAGLTGKTVGNHLDADGLAVGEFLDDRVQDHTHELSMTPNYSYLTGEGNYKVVPVSGGTTQTSVVSSTYRNGATTEVKSVGVNYIIKAKMVALPADFLAKVDEAVSEKADRATKVTATDLGFEANSTQSVKNTLNALGNYNVIQFRWGSATSFNISDGTNSIPSSGASILRASGEDSKKEAILIDANKNVYLIGFKNDSEYIKKLVTESDITPTQITGIVKADNDYTVNVYKSGNVVTVTFNSNKESAWALSQQLASGLPIPVGNAYHGMIMLTDGRITGLSVSGSGVLEVGYPTTSTGWLFGSITYICQ